MQINAKMNDAESLSHEIPLSFLTMKRKATYENKV